MEEIRLNKYLSEAGVCSRREADRLIEAGKVLIDGVPAKMGQRVQPGQKSPGGRYDPGRGERGADSAGGVQAPRRHLHHGQAGEA